MHTRRLALAVALTSSLVAAGACGSAPRSTSTPSVAPTTVAAVAAAPATAPDPASIVPSSSVPSARSNVLPDALVRAGDAVFVVSASSGGVRATWPGAVVAADGATAFRIATTAGRTDLVRIDTRDGAESGRWPITHPGAWRVAVVGADGRHVVLTDGLVDSAHRADRTRLVVADTSAGDRTSPRLLTETGTIEPEAIAADGAVVYVLDHRSTYYRVRSLVLADDVMYDTIGRDKAEPAEDMHGEAVRAVPSPDGTLLSTLYRLATPTLAATPFVHVLDLADGWSYCADLPPGEYDRIATSPDGRTLVVGGTDGSWVTIDLTDMRTPGDVPLPMTVHRAGTPPVTLATGGSSVVGDVTVTVDATSIAWHVGTTATVPAGTVPWPGELPAPQLAALIAP